MKKIFSLLFSLLVATSLFAIAASGKIGPTATWNYDAGTLRISGTGVTYDGSYSYNGMYQGAPKRMNAPQASPTGAISFKYGAEISGDPYKFDVDDVQAIIVDEGITKLGEWTFAFFHNVQTVKLPTTLTRFGGGAFLDNTSLTQITVPENVDTMTVAICKSANSIYGDDINYGAFHGCTKLKTVYWNVRGNRDGTIAQPLEGLEDILTKIVFGETVVHIPEKMCVYCKKISGELRIEKNIKTIGYAAFGECTGINKITLVADSLETVPTLFMNSKTFASQYYNYYGAPFAKCSKNMEIFIGKNVQYIGDFMFSDYERVGIMIAGYTTYRIDNNDYMDSLHITIEEGSNLKHIGDYAFAGAKGLMNFTLPDSIEEIMPYAFCGTDLKKIAIPAKTRKIGSCAFSSCPSLDSVYYNAQMADIAPDKQCIQNTWTYVYKSPFLNCSNELNIVVGNEVESILPYVFMGGERKGEYKNNTWSYTLSVLPRADIKSIVVKQNNKLKTISSYAFAGCSALTDFDFSKSTTIREYAFAQTGLKKIVIPESMSRIAPYAFDKCELDTVWFNAQMCGSSSIADVDTEIRTIASPFTNGSDATVFVIGEKASSIPAFFFSKYEYKESLNWVSPAFSPYFTKKPNNHYKIQFAPNSTISEIGACAFAGNMELEELIIPNECRSIGTSAFENCENIGYVQMRNPQAKNYAIEFGENIFSGCNKIQKVDWNIATSHFKSMQQTPFYNCAEKIESFTFGDIVWRIPNFLCANMTALKAMNLPKSVSNVGDSAFLNCTNVDTFYVQSPLNPPILGKKAFPADANIKVKCVVKEDFLNDTAWSKYNITSECILSEFTIRFYNWNDTLLQEEIVKEGEIPVYKGEIPTKEDDLYYSYTFKGWLPELGPATHDTNYYAQFEISVKEEEIQDVSTGVNSSAKILRDGQILILRGDKTYTLMGQEVK